MTKKRLTSKELKIKSRIDDDSRNRFNKAAKICMNNPKKACGFVGIINENTMEVSLFYGAPKMKHRPQSKKLKKVALPPLTPLGVGQSNERIKHLDDTIKLENSGLGTTLQSYARQDKNNQKGRATSHLQAVIEKNRKTVPNITVKLASKYLGFSLYLSFEKNKFLVSLDGKSASLNIVVPAIYDFVDKENIIDGEEIDSNIMKLVLTKIGLELKKDKNLMPKEIASSILTATVEVAKYFLPELQNNQDKELLVSGYIRDLYKAAKKDYNNCGFFKDFAKTVDLHYPLDDNNDLNNDSSSNDKTLKS